MRGFKRIDRRPAQLASEERWSLYSTTFTTEETGLFGFLLNVNDATGKGQTVYIRDLWLTEEQ